MRRNVDEYLCWLVIVGLIVLVMGAFTGYYHELSMAPATATPAPTPAPTSAPAPASLSTASAHDDHCGAHLCARIGDLLDERDADDACPAIAATLPYDTPCVMSDLEPLCVVGVCHYVADDLPGTCVMPERSDYDRAALDHVILLEFPCNCHCSAASL